MRVFGVCFQQQVQRQSRQKKRERQQQENQKQPDSVPWIQRHQCRIEWQVTAEQEKRDQKQRKTEDRKERRDATGAGQTKSPGRTVAQQSSADDQECIMIPQFNGQQTRKTDFVHQSCR